MIYENGFKNFINSEKETATSTLSAYISDVKEYERYLESKNKEIQTSTPDDVKAFLAKLKSDGRTGSTINRKMVSVRKYFDYLRRSGQISENPCTRIKVPRVEYSGPDYLSVEQIESLLNQPDDSNLGIRDKAILELLYASGLKATELISLNLQDVDLRIGFVSCRSDIGRSRIIPMGEPAKLALLSYLKSSRAALLGDKEDNKALFLNYNGERITRQGIWKIIKFYGKKAGIEDTLSPQIIRNSFAIHMIQNGADIRSLQELLGGDDASLTKLYVSFGKSRVMDVYDKTHPRAKK